MRAAARWFGAGLAAAPVLNVADDAGLINGLVTLDVSILGATVTSWAWIALFVGVGIAASALFVRHGTRGRAVLFVGCCVPLAAYLVVSGFRFSGLVAVLCLAVAIASWRARTPDPTAR